MTFGMTYHPKGERLANRDWRLRILLGRQPDVLLTHSAVNDYIPLCRQQLPILFNPQPSWEIRTTSPNVLMTHSRQPLPSYTNKAGRSL